MSGVLALNLIISINLVLAFLVLFFKKNNSLPNKVLALIIINPAMNFIANILIMQGLAYSFSWFIYASILTSLFFAPLVYYYVIIMMGMKFNWKNPVLFLTATALVYHLYTLISIVLKGAIYTQQFFHQLEHGPYPPEMEMMDTIFIALQQVYFIMALVQYVKYKGKLKNVFADFSNTKEKFVFYFIVLIFMLNLITIMLYASLPFSTVQYIYLPLVMMIVFLFVFIAAFNYHSVFNKQEYENFVFENEAIDQDLDSSPDLACPFEERLNLIAEKLIEKMNERHFCNKEMNIKVLAELVNEPTYMVSKCLNIKFKKSFFEFINGYRIKAFEKLTNTHAHLTIEGIALEVGFSNRASFYRIHKKMTGKTPKENMGNS